MRDAAAKRSEQASGAAKGQAGCEMCEKRAGRCLRVSDSGADVSDSSTRTVSLLGADFGVEDGGRDPVVCRLSQHGDEVRMQLLAHVGMHAGQGRLQLGLTAARVGLATCILARNLIERALHVEQRAEVLKLKVKLSRRELKQQHRQWRETEANGELMLREKGAAFSRLRCVCVPRTSRSIRPLQFGTMHLLPATQRSRMRRPHDESLHR